MPRFAVPALFVLLWSTGFIVARLVAPHIEPLTFLALRYSLTIPSLALIALAAGAAWPRGARAWVTAIGVGMLMQGVYLGGVFWSVRHGLPAGIAALIVGLQPLATAALAGPVLGERVSLQRWAGIVLGMLGVALVLLPGLRGGAGFPLIAVLVCVCAMAAITFGTIIQKRSGSALDLWPNMIAQFCGGFALTLPAAWLTETMRVDLGAQTLAGLFWAVFGLSVGANALLLLLIRRGAVAGVAALLYLVPPVAALMAYLMFGEALAPLQWAGMAVAAAGVAIASRG
jgi:drug/metabolite transporter (DMT)-like permease